LIDCSLTSVYKVSLKFNFVLVWIWLQLSAFDSQAQAIIEKRASTIAIGLSLKAEKAANSGKAKTAIKIYQEAIRLHKKSKDASVSFLANLYFEMGKLQENEAKYPAALDAIREALQIRKRQSEFHPERPRIENRLGNLLEKMGKFSESEAHFLTSLELRRKFNGDSSITYAVAADNLGALYKRIGRLSNAEFYYLQALGIRKKVLGTDSLDYGISCNNLAELYSEMGQPAKAEKLYKIAFNIDLKILGDQHPNFSIDCNNLGLLYIDMGDYQKAEPLLRKAFEIDKKTYGEDNPELSTTANNLGTLYEELNRLDEAEKLFNLAVKIDEKSLGLEHPDLATDYNNLAKVYEKQNKNLAAFGLYEKALAIWLKSLGEHHPLVSSARYNMASLAFETGKLTEAEPLLLLAWSGFQKHFGDYHPHLALAGLQLVRLYVKTKEFSKAIPFAMSAAEIIAKEIDFTFPVLSEMEKMTFLNGLESRLNILFSFGIHAGTSFPEAAEWVLNLRIKTKSLLLKSGNRIRKKIASSSDSTTKLNYEVWKQKRERWTRGQTLSLEEKSLKAWNMTAISDSINELEKWFSYRFPEEQEIGKADWKKIRDKLGSKEALVEILHLTPMEGVDPAALQTGCYAFVILKGGSEQKPSLLLKQGNEESTLREFAYFDNCIRNGIQDDLSFSKFWAPIQKELKGSKKIFISTDGVYSILQIAAIRDPETGRFVDEQYSIERINNPADVLRKNETEKQFRSAVLIGAPAFSESGYQHNMSVSEEVQRSGEIIHFEALPGATKELEAIGKVMKTTGMAVISLSGVNATEKNLKELHNPEILHIASHGFLFELDTSKSSKKASRFENQIQFRSGIVFSENGIEDGLLSAYEAQGLQLDSTRLVVLSACETGLGYIRNGEGVYGLQRAFQAAGSKSVLISYWKIKDDFTLSWMNEFYKQLLKTKSPQKALTLTRIQMRKKNPLPLFWAAFDLVGSE